MAAKAASATQLEATLPFRKKQLPKEWHCDNVLKPARARGFVSKSPMGARASIGAAQALTYNPLPRAPLGPGWLGMAIIHFVTKDAGGHLRVNNRYRC